MLLTFPIMKNIATDIFKVREGKNYLLTLISLEFVEMKVNLGITN